MLGIVFFALSYLLIGFSTQAFVFVVGVVIFFIGFNMHEPIMQSLASKFAKVHQRGLVLGIFNSFGYFGTFLGGLLGGVFFEKIALSTLVVVIAVVCILWIILILTMPNPLKKKLSYIPLDEELTKHTHKLDSINSIDEWYINNTENIIIVKYDSDLLSEEELLKLLNNK